MNTLNSNRKPLGIILISGFYVFGAMILLIFLFINPHQASSLIAERHGLPITTDSWILPVVAVFAFLIAWGLFSLARWGYVLTMVYSIYLGCMGLILSRGQLTTIDFGNFIWSSIVIIYLIIIRKDFFVNGK